MLPLTPTTPDDANNTRWQPHYTTRPQTLPTNITDTKLKCYGYEAQMIRFRFNDDTADDDTADSDPI